MPPATLLMFVENELPAPETEATGSA